MRILALVFVFGCGSKSAPPAQEPAPTGAPLAAEPAAEDGGPAPTDVKPEDASCPPLEQYSESIGKACPAPDVSCGYARCAKAKGFCNIIVCKGGTWQNIEVPPPPPPGVK